MVDGSGSSYEQMYTQQITAFGGWQWLPGFPKLMQLMWRIAFASLIIERKDGTVT
jgi:hypothetical protein